MNSPLTITAVTGALLVMLQVMFQAASPDWFWTIIQSKAEFWPAVQTLITLAAIKWFGNWVPPEKKP
jgi:hypothetical protein